MIGTDPFADATVKVKMRELQQKKYRQGYRNSQDVRGNPTYVLTDADKLSCLSPAMQQVFRDTQERTDRLKKYADPFEFSVGVGQMPRIYTIWLTHASWGHARRDGLADVVNNLPDPEIWFKQQIDDMKKELGWTAGHEAVAEVARKQKEKSERGFSVTDKHSKTKPEPLCCPDHGNELIRGTDPDTLVCTVVGCKKVARKKSTAKKHQETTLKVSEILSSSPAVQAMIEEPKPATVTLTPRPGMLVYLDRGPDGRVYLRQETPMGTAYIDITELYPQYTTKISNGITESTLVLGGVKIQ